ncbi:phosphoglycerate mutase family protein [Lacticaseibacillus paracasei subsp. tolerans DSM 20258]|nr:phosphoglycerate mutase family protein [Lacticaseibacillus paracasei subsp. tolerans DSM 20258]GEL38503.1 phosphoglycerate mutase [Lacticaseibacillus paracasei subsp. tolerans]
MIDRVVASDLLRAQETAQQILLGMQVKLAIETDKGLREENDGVFEGRSLKNVSQEVFGVPDYHILVHSGKMPLEAIPDGIHAADATNQAENTQQVVSRYDFAMRRIVTAAEAANETNVLVVSHGTASLLWLRAHGGDLPNRTELTNASVSKVTYDNGRFKVDWMDNTEFRDQGLKEELS